MIRLNIQAKTNGMHFIWLKNRWPSNDHQFYLTDYTENTVVQRALTKHGILKRFLTDENIRRPISHGPSFGRWTKCISNDFEKSSRVLYLFIFSYCFSSLEKMKPPRGLWWSQLFRRWYSAYIACQTFSLTIWLHIASESPFVNEFHIIFLLNFNARKCQRLSVWLGFWWNPWFRQ